MPELPDITIYLEALTKRIQGNTLERFVLQSPFVLRTVEPRPDDILGLKVVKLERLGKRIAIGFEKDYWIVFHLMIAGRFKWLAADKTPPKSALAFLSFQSGTLVLTEAGSKKRASIHLATTKNVAEIFDPGGAQLEDLDAEQFKQVLTATNHTLKRALTDPKLFSGIGNAYSDEILHAAKLSPIKQTQKLNDEEIETLRQAGIGVLQNWTNQLRNFYGDNFPTKVTAFRDGMAVHGRYQQPCPVCGTAVQRIRYASNEVNYCPRCQTDGKVLADRSLSRLLKKDWPKNIEELEKLNLNRLK